MLDLKTIVPEGWEVVDYRVPGQGDTYLGQDHGGAYSLCTNLHEHAFSPKLIVKRKRWRADQRGIYYFVDSTFCTLGRADDRDSRDNMLYGSGNYFRSQMVAERAAEVMKKSLEEFCILGEKK
jgi:hypothetical protein